jgi:membrane-bound metal-dependent hydrolase YbcI (DUF457 family)
MPFTPFHLGPGALLHAAAPRQISFLAFCAANVAIDVESLDNLVNHRHPVHAFFHSYVGSTLAAMAVIGLFLALRWLSARTRLPNLLDWKALSPRQVIVGAAAGAWSHVALDSLMHADIAPLAPWSARNALLGIVPLDLLHTGCAVAGLLGLAIIGVRRLIAAERSSG